MRYHEKDETFALLCSLEAEESALREKLLAAVSIAVTAKEAVSNAPEDDIEAWIRERTKLALVEARWRELALSR
jgi:hypothetical protein